MKKVCMVVGNFFTNDARVTKEATSLFNAGYDITVYARWKEGLATEEDVDGIKVKRLNIARYSPVRFNPYRIPTQLIPSILALTREKADIYHAHDLDTLFSCAIAARVNKSKLVYDSHELYLEMIKSHRTKTLLKRINAAILVFLYGLIERSFIHRANAIIDVSYFRRRVLASRYGLNEEEITVILNTPPKTWQVKKTQKLHKMFSLPEDAKIVLYQGGMLSGRGLDKLIFSTEFLPDDAYLFLIGGGDSFSDLKAVAEKSPAKDRIKFIPTVPLKELLSYTAAADVGVIQMLNTSLNNYYSMPNKIFEYMSVGLPVASPDFPELKQLLEEVQCGVVFNPEDPKDIARAINEILSDPAKAKKMGQNGLRAFNERYNWEVEEKKLLEIYQNL